MAGGIQTSLNTSFAGDAQETLSQAGAVKNSFKFYRSSLYLYNQSPKVGWKGRVSTLNFNARLKIRTLGSEDPKVQKWSNNKAQNIAWKSANPSQIEISDYI